MKGAIEQSWQIYCGTVYRGQNLSFQQVQEVKQAFYAGAFDMLRLMSEISVQIEDEDKAAQALETIRQELIEFHGARIRQMKQQGRG